MLSLLWTILKAIGMILVVLLIILLVLTAALLWIPFRYQVKASKQEEIHAGVRLSWLLRLVYISIQYENSKLYVILRILGIPVYDSRRPKKAKKKKVKTKKAAKQKKNRKGNKPKGVPQNELHTEAAKKIEDSSVSESKKQTADLSEAESVEETTEDVKPSEEKGGMKNRIKQIINTILAIPKKIRDFFRSMKEKICNAYESIRKIMKYPGKLKEFLRDEKNKSSIGVILQTIIRLVKHVRPRRVRGEITFGFDDPCTTGQVLGGASVAYAYLGLKYFRLIPDFQKSRFEGWITVRGRVYSFVVLKIVIRLLLDKNVKTFKDRINQLKEA